MVDPIIAPGLMAAVVKSGASQTGGILKRALGPSADVIGAHWAAQLEDRLSNVSRVAALASRRAVGDGGVPARVADSVMQSAQFADSDFVVEYLSGVLASSRTPGSIDDRGIAWTSLIAQLSTDQIRLHYGLYTAARRALIDHTARPTDSAMCKVNVFLSFSEIWQFMDWDQPTTDRLRFREAAYGLQRQQLLGTVSHGTGDFLRARWADRPIPEAGGLVYRPRVHGFGLYLWGLGAGGDSATVLLDQELELRPVGLEVPTLPHAQHWPDV